MSTTTDGMSGSCRTRNDPRLMTLLPELWSVYRRFSLNYPLPTRRLTL